MLRELPDPKGVPDELKESPELIRSPFEDVALFEREEGLAVEYSPVADIDSHEYRQWPKR